MESSTQPPVTLEGWYASHQVLTIRRDALRAQPSAALAAARSTAADVLDAACGPPVGGWSAVVRLVGSLANVLFVHFRPTLDALSAVEQEIAGLVIRGLSNCEIAGRLCIAEQTVKDQLHHVFEKMNIHRRSELAARVLELNPSDSPI